jgi:hypothetical protein
VTPPSPCSTRLLHQSVVINLDGESYRLRDHHAAADTLRRATYRHPPTDTADPAISWGISGAHTRELSMSAVRGEPTLTSGASRGRLASRPLGKTVT